MPGLAPADGCTQRDIWPEAPGEGLLLMQAAASMTPVHGARRGQSRRRPSRTRCRVVTADSDNQNPAAFLAGFALLFAGLYFSVAGGVRCWRLCRVWQVLRTAGWAQQHARIVTVPRDGWGGGGKVVIRQTETEPTVLKLPLSPGGHRALPDDPYTDIDLVLARGESGHWAAARDEMQRRQRGERPVLVDM